MGGDLLNFQNVTYKAESLMVLFFGLVFTVASLWIFSADALGRDRPWVRCALTHFSLIRNRYLIKK